MNSISRSVAKVLSSSLYHSRAAKLPTRKWVMSRQITSGGAPEKEVVPPKEIGYREELSNSVVLVGLVDKPVQFDGKSWAGTVISHHSKSNNSSFRIPIIFEGDLAGTAAQRLKKDDLIHVSGKLFHSETSPESNLQVMAQTFNLVQDISPAAMTISPPKVEEISTEKQPSKSEKVGVTDEDWKHLLENPNEWMDHRGNKANGLVNPKYPDFKRKTDGHALWLNRAPDGVLPGLQGLEFGVKKSRQAKDEFWNDLAENPQKWWDNRSNKTNPKSPDFKNKETGEGLWMNDSPTWVQSMLTPLKK